MRVNVMGAFAGIFLHVYVRKLHLLCFTINLYLHIAPYTNGSIHLRYLVAFRQIGIEIILTRKLIDLLDTAITGKAHFDGVFQYLLIQVRQSTGMTQGYRAHLRIRFCTKGGGIGTKYLAFSGKLGMHL